MPDNLIQLLVQSYGPTGIVLLACGLAINKLYNALQEANERRNQAQEQRVADVQGATIKLLELVAAQNRSTEILVKAIDANADATGELRTLLQTVLADRSERTHTRVAR